MQVKKVLGEGPESVYVFHYPFQEEQDADFPHKIGKAGRQGVTGRLKSLQAGMLEEPVVDLIFRCADSSYLERALHTSLRDVRMGAHGNEWFLTRPATIEDAWYDLVDHNSLPFHQRVRSERSLANMTQQQLAEMSGISTGELSALEQGFDVKVSTLVAVLGALGLGLRIE